MAGGPACRCRAALLLVFGPLLTGAPPPLADPQPHADAPRPRSPPLLLVAREVLNSLVELG